MKKIFLLFWAILLLGSTANAGFHFGAISAIKKQAHYLKDEIEAIRKKRLEELTQKAMPVKLAAETPTVIFTLGEKNNSDAEFSQTSQVENFYPQSQPVAEFSKELNLTFCDSQYLHLELDQPTVNQGLLMVMDPVWNNGTGTLTIALEVYTGNDFIEAGRTKLNGLDAGYVYIDPGFLHVGDNNIRMRAIEGTGGTTVVTWDQLARNART